MGSNEKGSPARMVLPVPANVAQEPRQGSPRRSRETQRNTSPRREGASGTRSHRGSSPQRASEFLRSSSPPRGSDAGQSSSPRRGSELSQNALPQRGSVSEAPRRLSVPPAASSRKGSEVSQGTLSQRGAEEPRRPSAPRGPNYLVPGPSLQRGSGVSENSFYQQPGDLPRNNSPYRGSDAFWSRTSSPKGGELPAGTSSRRASELSQGPALRSGCQEENELSFGGPPQRGRTSIRNISPQPVVDYRCGKCSIQPGQLTMTNSQMLMAMQQSLNSQREEIYQRSRAASRIGRTQVDNRCIPISPNPSDLPQVTTQSYLRPMASPKEDSARVNPPKRESFQVPKAFPQLALELGPQDTCQPPRKLIRKHVPNPKDEWTQTEPAYKVSVFPKSDSPQAEVWLALPLPTEAEARRSSLEPHSGPTRRKSSPPREPDTRRATPEPPPEPTRRRSSPPREPDTRRATPEPPPEPTRRRSSPPREPDTRRATPEPPPEPTRRRSSPPREPDARRGTHEPSQEPTCRKSSLPREPDPRRGTLEPPPEPTYRRSSPPREPDVKRTSLQARSEPTQAIYRPSLHPVYESEYLCPIHQEMEDAWKRAFSPGHEPPGQQPLSTAEQRKSSLQARLEPAPRGSVPQEPEARRVSLLKDVEAKRTPLQTVPKSTIRVPPWPDSLPQEFQPVYRPASHPESESEYRCPFHKEMEAALSRSAPPGTDIPHRGSLVRETPQHGSLGPAWTQSEPGLDAHQVPRGSLQPTTATIARPRPLSDPEATVNWGLLPPRPLSKFGPQSTWWPLLQPGQSPPTPDVMDRHLSLPAPDFGEKRPSLALDLREKPCSLPAPDLREKPCSSLAPDLREMLSSPPAPDPAKVAAAFPGELEEALGLPQDAISTSSQDLPRQTARFEEPPAHLDQRPQCVGPSSEADDLINLQRGKDPLRFSAFFVGMLQESVGLRLVPPGRAPLEEGRGGCAHQRQGGFAKMK
ncbi:serine/arginine repetitive matrix protein 1-like [Podarcis raffonei]|uniref:serine/arginine repetitive matrix protein 1-like n=1 Tax=Podarcis raffonei TaxID=65483 RepID=UPI002329462E|nr:serine/arginine repetitive matrix protein 1-like [Podarcis raffonei]